MNLRNVGRGSVVVCFYSVSLVSRVLMTNFTTREILTDCR